MVGVAHGARRARVARRGGRPRRRCEPRRRGSLGGRPTRRAERPSPWASPVPRRSAGACARSTPRAGARPRRRRPAQGPLSRGDARGAGRSRRGRARRPRPPRAEGGVHVDDESLHRTVLSPRCSVSAMETLSVRSADLTLHVEVDGGGPTVLLLHGWPDTGALWVEVAPALVAAGYRVAVPDLRGCGRSDKPEDLEAYRMHHLLGDVGAIVDALGVESVHLVGHDWGANLAWACAALRPELVSDSSSLSLGHPTAFCSGGPRAAGEELVHAALPLRGSRGGLPAPKRLRGPAPVGGTSAQRRGHRRTRARRPAARAPHVVPREHSPDVSVAASPVCRPSRRPRWGCGRAATSPSRRDR